MPPDDATAQARRLHERGDLQAAESAYRDLLKQSPADPAAHELWRYLAELCRDQGRLPEARGAFEAALRLQPDDADALNGYGITLAQLGKISDAIRAFGRATQISPDYAQAHYNLGVALAESGDAPLALERFRHVLQIKPDYLDACLGLGNVLSTMGKNDQATDAYRQALAISPHSAEALNGLGLALNSLRFSAEAAIFLKQAIRLRPDMTGPYNNLGLAYAEDGKYAAAESAYEQALRLDPGYAEAHVNLGNAFKEQGRLTEALACYDLALWNKPQSTSAQWNRSLTLLQKGDYQAGWRTYESRWLRKGALSLDRFTQPMWNGEPLAERTILVHAEQGLGDMVQFIRYARLLKEQGATVVVESPSPLTRLLESCPGIDGLLTEGETLPPYNFHVPVMSLPRLFNTTVSTIPAAIPYLAADPERVAYWESQLKSDSELRVGIAWQGNPHHLWDRHRSIPLLQFARLSRVPGVRFVSLQRGPGREQLETIGTRLSITECLDPSLDDADGLLEMAAIIKNLDLVISVDTAVVHIAGALGTRVWTLLSTMVDWRWMLNRQDTPWYPSMRLFRQRDRGEWQPVLERVAEELTTISVGPALKMDPPLISCLCVTRGRPEMLRRAIHCFRRQTHPSKELIIVADDDDRDTLSFLDALPHENDIRHVIVRTSDQYVLGDLRNIAINRARGEYFAQWDDDDFYRSNRLTAQLSAIQRSGKPACVLLRWIIHQKGRNILSSKRLWEGSLVCRRSEIPPYPSVRQGEDSPVVSKLESTGRICVIDVPGLYMYIHHGGNTWNQQHWDTLVRSGGADVTAEQFPIIAEFNRYNQDVENQQNLLVSAEIA